MRRDVRPWLGDEAAVALVELGGGRFGSLVLARVRDEPKAEALLQRVAGARPGTRYTGTVVRRFGANAAAFVRGYLVAGPELAVQRSIDAAEDDAPALAESDVFERALAGAERPAQVYVAPRGLRAAPGGGVAGALVARCSASRGLRALGAAAAGGEDGLRVSVRSVGTGGRTAADAGPDGALALAARVPAEAIALLAAPEAAAVVAAVERAGGAAAAESVRSTLAEEASLDVDRDLLGAPARRLRRVAEPGRGGAGDRARRAHPTTPRACARCSPACRTRWPARSPRIRTRRRSSAAATIAGADAFTLQVSDGFAPTYAVADDTVVVATAPEAVEAFLAPRQPSPRWTRPAFRVGDARSPAQNRVARLLRRTPAPHARRADRVDRRGPSPGPRRQRRHPA